MADLSQPQLTDRHADLSIDQRLALHTAADTVVVDHTSTANRRSRQP
jgi:hypothetical protein